jgi:hypothetical protein
MAAQHPSPTPKRVIAHSARARAPPLRLSASPPCRDLSGLVPCGARRGVLPRVHDGRLFLPPRRRPPRRGRVGQVPDDHALLSRLLRWPSHPRYQRCARRPRARPRAHRARLGRHQAVRLCQCRRPVLLCQLPPAPAHLLLLLPRDQPVRLSALELTHSTYLLPSSYFYLASHA